MPEAQIRPAELVPIRTYLIETSDKNALQIEIPEDWKVTYGPVTPGSKSYGGDNYALRIYESDTKQRAIFTNVRSFRDLSIPVRRLIRSVEGESTWYEDESISSTASQTRVREEWKDV
jgi:hypothetical protein